MQILDVNSEQASSGTWERIYPSISKMNADVNRASTPRLECKEKMSAAAITLNELEGRGHAILADASLTIATVAKHSRLAVKHYRLMRSLRSMEAKMEDFLTFLHVPETIESIEGAASQDLAKVAQVIGGIPSKITESITSIRNTEMSYWARLYEPYLIRLEARNRELQSHLDAFNRAADSPLIMLSNADQDQLVSALLDPPEPTEAFRRAFGLK